MDGESRPVDARAKRTLVAVASLYALGAALILLWPSSVTAPHQELLDQAANAFPDGDILLEVIANVLLFLPAGWLAGAFLPRGRRWLAVPAGVLASGSVELAQALILPERVSSPRDVLANSAGVALGLAIAIVLDRARSGRQGKDGPQTE